MTLNINILILLALSLLYLTFYLFAQILLNKFTSLDELFIRSNKRLSVILTLVKHEFNGTMESLRDIKNLKQNLILERTDEGYKSDKMKRIEQLEIKKLGHSNPIRRKEASVYLSLIASLQSRLVLERALILERDNSVRIYISNALVDIGSKESISPLISALFDTSKWYREKAISNLLEFGADLQPYMLRNKDELDLELIELFIKYASENFNKESKTYLFQFVDNFDQHYQNVYRYYEQRLEEGKTNYKLSYLKEDMSELLIIACRTLADYYYADFSSEKYYSSTNDVISTNAFWALSKTPSTDNFKVLMGFLDNDKHEKAIISVLTKMVEKNPRFLYLLEESFEKELDVSAQKRIAQVLSNKIEYYILKLNQQKNSRAEIIIKTIVGNGRINELIGFLNINKNIDIENRLITILKESVQSDSEVETEFRSYLDQRILSKWGLEAHSVRKDTRGHKKDKSLIKSVLLMTVVAVLLVPILFLVARKDWVWTAPPMLVLKQYVIDFNYALAYYSVVINGIYIMLLVFSYENVKRQSQLWQLKNISMLFRKHMIPSISIIAPAYNEEKNIIESANSLLNLNYPDYELIIVNDGSKDETLMQLIKAFSLVRVDYQYTTSLNTAPIRGIYKNPSLPKLVVIDKSNGGKADSLNAGINVANKTYFCGIDADSLLEPEALLKLAALTLDESVETPALGGNIFPINGCVVDRGHISEIHIPKNTLAKFQTIEYLRAFMAGRLGWERIDSLMIISGAFGLFRKDRIIGIGGYMTEKGQYQKDTVGEDMELVVRLARLMHELKKPYKILYSYNANCWTEVPEDLKSLKSQRYRWHRGLIDILFFHRKILFNKKYGRVGLFAMPYFLIFEAFGPMLEIQGYLMVVLAAFLGILNPEIALLLFISSILLGLIVSFSSLLIAERETHYFTVKDLLKLMGISLIENFGPRQLFSVWRVLGQFNVIFGQGGWGQIKRKGVSS